MKNKKFCLALLALFVVGLSWFAYKITLATQDVVYLYEKDINDASTTGKNGYLISKPGKYVLAKDIDWSVNTPDSFAITVAAHNVTLDGNGHTIKQLDTAVKHAIGIHVLAGAKNVKIENFVLKTLSGGGIWFRGANEEVAVIGIKTINCGYLGKTMLDSNGMGPKAPQAFTQGILLDGGHGRPIKKAQITNCTFVESGILRDKEPKYETACGAMLVYQAEDITIKGCAIDGCVGRDVSWGLTLIAISNALASDVVITDVMSRGDAQGVHHFDVGGQITQTESSSIFSKVPVSQFITLLETHGDKPVTAGTDATYYPIEYSHLKEVVPQHRENEPLLFEEHTWKEFRTLSRLVCHNSHKLSKTSGIYARWVELFCEKALGVKVKVVGGFANLYPTGETPLPAHRDNFGKWVFGLSFGETRTFDFVPDNKNHEISSFELKSGDIFLFSPGVNEHYMHRMLPEPEKTGRRINLTYILDVLPGEDELKLLEPSTGTIPSFEEALALYNQKESAQETKRVILQDEHGNYYEEINGVVVPLQNVKSLR